MQGIIVFWSAIGLWDAFLLEVCWTNEFYGKYTTVVYWITVALLLKSGQCIKGGMLMQSGNEDYWLGVSKWALQHLLRSDSAEIRTCHISTSNFLTYQQVTLKSVDRRFVDLEVNLNANCFQVWSPCLRSLMCLSIGYPDGIEGACVLIPILTE